MSEQIFGLWFFKVRRQPVKGQPIEQFVYGYSMPLDADYTFPEEDGSTSIFKNNLELVVTRKTTTAKYHEKLLEELIRDRCFPSPWLEDSGMQENEAFTHRPFIFQFDPNTVREKYVTPVAESIAPFLAEVKSFVVLDKFAVLENALGFGDSDTQPNDNPQKVQWLLNELKAQTGLDFLNGSLTRFGNFEVFNFPLGSVLAKPPITVIPVTPEDKDNWGGNSTMVRRTGNFANNRHLMHLVLRNGGDVIFERIAILEKGDAESGPFEAQEDFYEHEIWVFDESGNRLLFHERLGYMRGVTMFTSLGTSRRQILDKFLQKMKSDRRHKKLADQLEYSNGSSIPLVSQVGGSRNDPWISAGIDFRQRVQPLIDKPRMGLWFHGRLEGEARAILQLRAMADGKPFKQDALSRVILTDPYFDTNAFEKWLIRLENQDRKLTILTCPDTKDRERIDGLKAACEEHINLIPPSTRIISLAHLAHSTKNAFHDRFLIRVMKNGNVQVTLLSNSLNNAANHDPLCVIDLEDGLAREIYQYVLGLESGIDVTAPDREIKMEILWSPEIRKEKLQLQSLEELSEGEGSSIWKTAVDWMFKSPDGSRRDRQKPTQDIDRIQYNNGWYFSTDAVRSRLQEELDSQKVPDYIEEATRLTVAVGEILARVVITKEVQDLFEDYATSLLAHFPPCEILDIAAQLYEMDPTFGKLWKQPLVDLDHAAHWLLRHDSISYSLLESVTGYFYHPVFMFPQPYGLKKVVKILISKDPYWVILWFESIQAEKPKLYSFMLSFLYESITIPKNRVIIAALLGSRTPFLKMLGAARLQWSVDRKEKLAFDFNEALAMLNEARFDPEDILWIMTHRVIEERRRWLMAREKTIPSEEFTNADRDFKALLRRLANLWPQSRLSLRAFTEFEASIGRSTRECFLLAEMIREIDQGRITDRVKQLYIQCVDDAEKTIGRIETDFCSDFFLSGTDGLEFLQFGARSFVILNGELAYKRFRNRYENHIEKLQSIGLKPFAHRKNSDLFRSNFGRLATTLYFGFCIDKHARNCVEGDSINLMIKYLLEQTHRLFLCEQGDWRISDTARILDTLAFETAVAASFHANPQETYDPAESITSDDRNPLFFRTHVAVFHPAVFTNNPGRSLKLLQEFRETYGKHQIDRYFQLLDVFIGRAFTAGQPPAEAVIKEIQIGIAELGTNIKSNWRTYYEYIWDALHGTETAVSLIRELDKTKSGFCQQLIAGTDYIDRF